MKKLALKLYSGLKELPHWYKYVLTLKNWHTYVWDWLGFIKKDKIIITLRSGLKCKLRADTTDRIVINNILIKNAFMLNGSDVRKYSTVIDIGAHIGFFSILIASLARDVKVYAYEPEPSNYELLVENIKLNRLEDRVFPFNYAVSDSKGLSILYVTPGLTMAHSTVIPFSESIEVSCLSLGNIFRDNHIQKCDLLKINAEGAEYPILLNASEQTLSRTRTICVQCHNIDEKHNVSQLENFLVKNNFRVIRKGEFVKATNESKCNEGND